MKFQKCRITSRRSRPLDFQEKFLTRFHQTLKISPPVQTQLNSVLFCIQKPDVVCTGHASQIQFEKD